MIQHLFLISLFFSCILATLPLPEHPYSGDRNQNYLYERACHHYALELSTSRYESHAVRSKIFQSLYLECLDVIWPGCEVTSAVGLMTTIISYFAFNVNDEIVSELGGGPAVLAHKPGFLVENLLEPEHRWFIFWDPLEPQIDIERFQKVCFVSPQTLYHLHLTVLTKSIKGFQNAGIEPSDKIYLKKDLPNGQYKIVMSFQKFKDILEKYLTKIEMEGFTPTLASGHIDGLKSFLCKYLPPESISGSVFPNVDQENAYAFFIRYIR